MKKLLVVLCCLELLLVTFLINEAGPHLSPILFLASSLGIGWLYLKIASQPDSNVEQEQWKVSPRVITIIQWVLFLGLSYIIFSILKHYWWYVKMYGDPQSKSDIIPQINTLIVRFLGGEQPYRTIQFSDYQLFPTYMPFQWLPYIPCELTQKDYRWIPTFAAWAACLYYFISKQKNNAYKLGALLVPIWPMIVWLVFVLHDQRMFVFSVEGLIAGYYFFVAESIGKKKAWPLALGIAICLLSRYSIVFWVPLCLLCYYIAGKRKEAVIVSLTVAVFFILFYWLPFLRKDPTIFLQGYAYHTKATYHEWVKDLQMSWGEIYLFNGLSFTSFAMRLPGGIANKIMLYKTIQLTLCVLTIAGLAWFYVKHRARYNLNIFLLFSFKVYLAVFYAFIQIPYKYLFFIPLMVSASLLGGAFRTYSVKESRTLQQ